LAKLTGADVKGIPDSVTPEKKKKEKKHHKKPHMKPTHYHNKTKQNLGKKKEKPKRRNRVCRRTLHRWATGREKTRG